jgi:hypothetical protein
VKPQSELLESGGLWSVRGGNSPGSQQQVEKRFCRLGEDFVQSRRLQEIASVEQQWLKHWSRSWFVGIVVVFFMAGFRCFSASTPAALFFPQQRVPTSSSRDKTPSAPNSAKRSFSLWYCC